MTDKIVVLTTCDSEQQATRIARHLVEERLAACVNIISRATSVYRWKGKIESAEEWLLIVKSRRELVPDLRAALEKLHSYEIPELITISIDDGAAAYLAWLDDELKAAE